MKISNDYLQKADAAIIKTKIAQNGKIPKAYKGAVSSFGASLVMSGLIPTLQFFMAESDKRDSDTRKIIDAIAQIVYGEEDAEGLKQKAMKQSNNKVELNLLKQKIVNAAIALKIMMRTYNFSEDKEKK